MQLPFIAARHPAAIVSVNGVASDLFGPFLGFCRRGVQAFAVGVARAAANQNSRSKERQGWNNLAVDGAVKINRLHSVEPL